MKTVGIIGASGYVGQHIAKLLSNEFEVTALQRNIHAVMPLLPRVKISSLNDNKQTFDVLINTSYSQDKNIKRVYRLNHEVLQQIKAASHASTQIIHLSSLAVFGFGLEKPIIPDSVRLEQDYVYVQSKVHMENLLLQHIAHQQLSIIRLGNVWGAGNNSWTQPVADALQWGLPVLSTKPAFCNITYVHNIADYTRHIINSTEHLLFHHMAEFSNITWQQVVKELGAHMNAIPVLINSTPFYAKSLSEDLQHAVNISPLAILKQLRNGRFTSHYFPHQLFHVLNLYMPKKKQAKTGKIPFDPSPTFLWVLSCETESKSFMLPDWRVPYSWEEVKADVFRWLNEAGFTSQ